MISPRTVETHIRNILAKYECHSREEIISFIEKAGEYSLFKDHYLFLLRSFSFKKILQKIAGIYKQKALPTITLYGQNLLLCHLAAYLKIVGVEVTLNKKTKSPTTLPETLPIIGIIERKAFLNDSSMYIALLSVHAESPQKVENVDYINMDLDNSNAYQAMEDFYAKFFLVAKKILPHSTHLNTLLDDFQKSASTFQNVLQYKHNNTAFIKKSNVLKTLVSRVFLHQKKLFMSVSSVLFIGIFAFFLNFYNPSPHNRHTVRSILSLPNKQYLLDRSSLIEKIHEGFKRQSSDIKNMMIIGAGGAGKTTIARLYARSQNIPVIWEINAETKENLLSSFKDLASALSKTPEQKNDLELIQKNTDAREHEKQLLLFVKNRLKEEASWFLIYDNVEALSDIKDFIPEDEKSWGTGSLLMTTRDINSQNTSYTSTENTLFIEELDQTEALTLFSQILYDKQFNQLPSAQREELIPFVQKLPHFPLDISIAAYYIKNTHLTFEQYLERIETFCKEFDQAQASLLKKVNHYTKTRYGIISASLEKILEIHPDFKALLFLICLFNSQDIPTNFLIHYKDQLMTDQFMYQLKKHGLVTHESLSESEISSYTFSLHRSTQAMGLNFLNNILSKEEKSFFINTIIKSFQAFKELGPTIKSFSEFSKSMDCLTRTSLFPHLETLYLHVKEMNLSEEISSKCQAYLWFLNGTTSYCCLSNMLLCKKYLSPFFETAATKNCLQHLPLNMQVIMLLALGTTYIDLGKPAEGLNYLQKALPIIEQISGAEIMHSETLRLIGVAYSRKNEFEPANHFLKRALSALPPADTPLKRKAEAETYLQLASSYSNHFLHKDSTAETYMLKVLEIMGAAHLFYEKKEHSPQLLTSTIAKQKERLGEAYNRLGRYRDAIIKGLREADYIMEHGHLSSHQFLKAEIDLNMGEALLREGNLKEAEQKLTDSLRVSEKILGPTAACTWHAKIYRTEVYLRLGKLKEAYEDCLSVLGTPHKKTYPYSDLLYATELYYAAIIAHKQRCLEKSVEHFREFFNAIKGICQAFLDEQSYKNLDFQGIFNTLEQKKDIKICFQQSAIIFSSIYGKEHPFVRDFVLTNDIT